MLALSPSPPAGRVPFALLALSMVIATLSLTAGVAGARLGLNTAFTLVSGALIDVVVLAPSWDTVARPRSSGSWAWGW